MGIEGSARGSSPLFDSWDEVKAFLAKTLPHREFVELVCKHARDLENGSDLNEATALKNLVLDAIYAFNRLIDNLLAKRNPDQVLWDTVRIAACMMLIARRAGAGATAEDGCATSDVEVGDEELVD